MTVKLVTVDAFATLFRPRRSPGHLYWQAVQRCWKPSVDHVGDGDDAERQLNASFLRSIKQQQQQHPNYGVRRGMSAKEWWRDVVRNTLNQAALKPALSDEQHRQVFELLYEGFTRADHFDLFPDVSNGLDEIKRHGAFIAVLSNADNRLFSVLDALDLSRHLLFTLTSHMAGCSKPDVRIFEMCRQLYSLQTDEAIQPHEILHIGDDIDKDYRAARAAGFHALRIERGQPSAMDQIDSFAQVAQHLDRLGRENDR
ncbi:hypothetical protein RI367_000815 [Sorochytrium milnesiophthora]